jgi:hypothetical protein
MDRVYDLHGDMVYQPIECGHVLLRLLCHMQRFAFNWVRLIDFIF